MGKLNDVSKVGKSKSGEKQVKGGVLGNVECTRKGVQGDPGMLENTRVRDIFSLRCGISYWEAREVVGLKAKACFICLS